MARGMDEAEKSLVSLEKEITCGVCHLHYQQPKLLPCLHFYCKECILEQALKAGNSKPFPCPECCKEVSLPEGNVDNLQTVVFINRLKDQYTQLEKAFSKETKCEMCSTSEAQAEAFCRHCNYFICKECVESHHKMRVFHSHEVISFDEVKKVGTKDLPTRSTPAKECGRHQKSLDIFCLDCSNLICCDCTIRDHRDHSFEFCRIATIDIKKELMDSLMPLRELGVRLSDAVEEVKRAENALEAQAVSVVNSINTSFEQLHMILERRKQQLLEEARREVSDKKMSLKEQEGNLSIASAEVHGIINYTGQCVRHCSDDEIMCIHAEIGSRIKQEIEGCGQPGSIIMPVEQVELRMEVRCAEALEQLCHTRAKIVKRIGNVVVRVNKIANEAEINKMSEVIMFVSPTKPDTKIDCHLSSLYNRSPIEYSVKELGAEEYHIQYTPTVRGRHELSLSVNRQPVAGSPFPVRVCYPPTLLDKPIRFFHCSKGTCGITINSVGEIIVVEYEGDVVVMDKNGTRLRSINTSEHQFNCLLGVTVDREENIYFTDEGTNRIFKSNMNCSKVQVQRVEQVQGPGHYGVAVVGDEVMVTECGNKGMIMVYNRDLKYVRQIIGVHNSKMHGLCPDSHQNVYACDSKNSCIQVFSKGGELLRSFGSNENGIKRLQWPYGVCVAGQYVYVTDDVCKIFVFTTEGYYVTSFGGYYSPGVCMDQDGFMYVTDCYHSKINIY